MRSSMRLSSAVVGALVMIGVHSQEPATNALTSGAASQEYSAYSLATTLLQTLSLAASARDTLAANKAEGNPITDSLNAIVAQRVQSVVLTKRPRCLVSFEARPMRLCERPPVN